MEKTSKFYNAPVEEDTKIISRAEEKLGKYDVLYENWFWDGVTAESLIFVEEDVSNLSDDEIKEEVKESPLLKKDSEITMKHSEGYVFVNFNFEVDNEG